MKTIAEQLKTQLSEDSEEELHEVSPKKERVVRGGEVKVKKTCPKGYKLKGNRCEKQSAKEQRRRSRAAKKAAKSRRGNQQSSERQRKRSQKKRDRRNL